MKAVPMRLYCHRMQTDPSRDWQALSALYRAKSNEELDELALEYGDLTEVAQEVLRAEIRSRGLEDPAAPKTPEKRPKKSSAPGENDDAESGGEDGHEFTWKTPLCTCATIEQAKQIAEMLRRAQIESWVEGGLNPWDAGNIRVLVAADELDEARAVLEKPIPQDVVEETTMQVPEFVAPACPACGAEDPVLEAVEPANQWLCEVCGRQWSEGVGTETGDSRH
ncbi:MAG TPA: hypothetical protein VFU68_08850 [Terracidiphilus sp.]|nr:hypothetical protein [Terracidiphilus sp.]